MNINIKATGLHLTDAIKAYTIEKINNLEEFQDDLQLAKIELVASKEKNTDEHFRAEATIDAPHHVYRAEAGATDLYAAIDLLIPKIISQIEKQKTKRLAKSRGEQRKFKEEIETAE